MKLMSYGTLVLLCHDEVAFVFATSSSLMQPCAPLGSGLLPCKNFQSMVGFHTPLLTFQNKALNHVTVEIHAACLFATRSSRHRKRVRIRFTPNLRLLTVLPVETHAIHTHRTFRRE